MIYQIMDHKTNNLFDAAEMSLGYDGSCMLMINDDNGLEIIFDLDELESLIVGIRSHNQRVLDRWQRQKQLNIKKVGYSE